MFLFRKWAFSGLLFLFKSFTCPLLYATQAVAGSTFFSNQKKVAKRIFTRLDAMRFAPAKRRVIPVPPQAACRAARQSELSRLSPLKVQFLSAC